MDRKRYWDEKYLHYWQQRTADNGGQVVRGDCIPADVSLFEHYLQQLELKPENRVLEVGVGFGRLVPSLLKHGAVVYGLDISGQMIADAQRRWGSQVAELREGQAEHLPYQNAFFNHVICWAVFDACFQGQALSEMVRVLQFGGRLLLTGKNNDYWDDDELAYVAETNARAKGHPNFFTNFAALCSALPEIGLRVERILYFERRGHFSENRYVLVPPMHFYEYLMIGVKDAHTARKCSSTLADKFSSTFGRRTGASLLTTERI